MTSNVVIHDEKGDIIKDIQVEIEIVDDTIPKPYLGGFKN
eukprot:CAMPEP_0205849506 /NCGR_PEP_ID=MMETSP1019-20131125/20541_1 /ASSEMBLY_ACC=CAM_ASM_000403 /TAXON_ID=46462 /ORGANISM="Anophryoides haemophila, Strain AH6" /LENGTH=39 /DNA_ID= /DNA_START= /DNA_END= /DNA_ORIENTATION=